MKSSGFLDKNTDKLDQESLGEKIELIIQKMPPGEVTLSAILDIVGYDSLLLLTVFLSLVFLVPVSIPGVSTVFGGAILLIGIARLFSHKLWLPKRIAERTISTEKLVTVLQRALVWFGRLEKISRPRRMQWLTTDGRVGVLNGLSYVLAALLLMVPFSFIPFSNTLPAVALIFLAVGMMQKDGGCILLGHLANLATIIYFSALIAGGGMILYEIWGFFSGL